MNGEVNCITAVCCPPDSDTQREALVRFLEREVLAARSTSATAIDPAQEYADVILRHFDLAEKGTLQPLKDSIAKLARGPRHK